MSTGYVNRPAPTSSTPSFLQLHENQAGHYFNNLNK